MRIAINRDLLLSHTQPQQQQDNKNPTADGKDKDKSYNPTTSTTTTSSSIAATYLVGGKLHYNTPASSSSSYNSNNGGALRFYPPTPISERLDLDKLGEQLKVEKAERKKLKEEQLQRQQELVGGRQNRRSNLSSTKVLTQQQSSLGGIKKQSKVVSDTRGQSKNDNFARAILLKQFKTKSNRQMASEFSKALSRHFPKLQSYLDKDPTSKSAVLELQTLLSHMDDESLSSNTAKDMEEEERVEDQQSEHTFDPKQVANAVQQLNAFLYPSSKHIPSSSTPSNDSIPYIGEDYLKSFTELCQSNLGFYFDKITKYDQITNKRYGKSVSTPFGREYGFSLKLRKQLLNIIANRLFVKLVPKSSITKQFNIHHQKLYFLLKQLSVQKNHRFYEYVESKNLVGYFEPNADQVLEFNKEMANVEADFYPLWKKFLSSVTTYGKLESIMLHMNIATNVPVFYPESIRDKANNIKQNYKTKLEETHYEYLKSYKALRDYLEAKLWLYSSTNDGSIHVGVVKELSRVEKTLILRRTLNQLYDENPWLLKLNLGTLSSISSSNLFDLQEYEDKGEHISHYNLYGCDFDNFPESLRKIAKDVIRDVHNDNTTFKYQLLDESTVNTLHIEGVMDPMALHLKCLNMEIELISTLVSSLESLIGFKLDAHALVSSTSGSSSSSSEVSKKAVHKLDSDGDVIIGGKQHHEEVATTDNQPSSSSFAKLIERTSVISNFLYGKIRSIGSSVQASKDYVQKTVIDKVTKPSNFFQRNTPTTITPTTDHKPSVTVDDSPTVSTEASEHELQKLFNSPDGKFRLTIYKNLITLQSELSGYMTALDTTSVLIYEDFVNQTTDHDSSSLSNDGERVEELQTRIVSNFNEMISKIQDKAKIESQKKLDEWERTLDDYILKTKKAMTLVVKDKTGLDYDKLVGYLDKLNHSKVYLTSILPLTNVVLEATNGFQSLTSVIGLNGFVDSLWNNLVEKIQTPIEGKRKLQTQEFHDDDDADDGVSDDNSDDSVPPTIQHKKLKRSVDNVVPILSQDDSEQEEEEEPQKEHLDRNFLSFPYKVFLENRDNLDRARLSFDNRVLNYHQKILPDTEAALVSNDIAKVKTQIRLLGKLHRNIKNLYGRTHEFYDEVVKVVRNVDNGTITYVNEQERDYVENAIHQLIPNKGDGPDLVKRYLEPVAEFIEILEGVIEQVVAREGELEMKILEEIKLNGQKALVEFAGKLSVAQKRRDQLSLDFISLRRHITTIVRQKKLTLNVLDKFEKDVETLNKNLDSAYSDYVKLRSEKVEKDHFLVMRDTIEFIDDKYKELKSDMDELLQKDFVIEKKRAELKAVTLKKDEEKKRQTKKEMEKLGILPNVTWIWGMAREIFQEALMIAIMEVSMSLASEHGPKLLNTNGGGVEDVDMSAEDITRIFMMNGRGGGGGDDDVLSKEYISKQETCINTLKNALDIKNYHQTMSTPGKTSIVPPEFLEKTPVTKIANNLQALVVDTVKNDVTLLGYSGVEGIIKYQDQATDSAPPSSISNRGGGGWSFSSLLSSNDSNNNKNNDRGNTMETYSLKNPFEFMDGVETIINDGANEYMRESNFKGIEDKSLTENLISCINNSNDPYMKEWGYGILKSSYTLKTIKDIQQTQSLNSAATAADATTIDYKDMLSLVNNIYPNKDKLSKIMDEKMDGIRLAKGYHDQYDHTLKEVDTSLDALASKLNISKEEAALKWSSHIKYEHRIASDDVKAGDHCDHLFINNEFEDTKKVVKELSHKVWGYSMAATMKGREEKLQTNSGGGGGDGGLARITSKSLLKDFAGNMTKRALAIACSVPMTFAIQSALYYSSLSTYAPQMDFMSSCGVALISGVSVGLSMYLTRIAEQTERLQHEVNSLAPKDDDDDDDNHVKFEPNWLERNAHKLAFGLRYGPMAFNLFSFTSTVGRSLASLITPGNATTAVLSTLLVNSVWNRWSSSKKKVVKQGVVQSVTRTLMYFGCIFACYQIISGMWNVNVIDNFKGQIGTILSTFESFSEFSLSSLFSSSSTTVPSPSILMFDGGAVSSAMKESMNSLMNSIQYTRNLPLSNLGILDTVNRITSHLSVVFLGTFPTWISLLFSKRGVMEEIKELWTNSGRSLRHLYEIVTFKVLVSEKINKKCLKYLSLVRSSQDKRSKKYYDSVEDSENAVDLKHGITDTFAAASDVTRTSDGDGDEKKNTIKPPKDHIKQLARDLKNHILKSKLRAKHASNYFKLREVVQYLKKSHKIVKFNVNSDATAITTDNPEANMSLIYKTLSNLPRNKEVTVKSEVAHIQVDDVISDLMNLIMDIIHNQKLWNDTLKQRIDVEFPVKLNPQTNLPLSSTKDQDNQRKRMELYKKIYGAWNYSGLKNILDEEEKYPKTSSLGGMEWRMLSKRAWSSIHMLGNILSVANVYSQIYNRATIQTHYLPNSTLMSGRSFDSSIALLGAATLIYTNPSVRNHRNNYNMDGIEEEENVRSLEERTRKRLMEREEERIKIKEAQERREEEELLGGF